jgi:hypothetical protein
MKFILWRFVSVLALFGITCAIWLSACAKGPDLACKVDDDCPANMYCDLVNLKQCNADCSSDANCKTNERCNARSQCQRIATEPPPQITEQIPRDEDQKQEITTEPTTPEFTPTEITAEIPTEIHTEYVQPTEDAGAEIIPEQPVIPTDQTSIPGKSPLCPIDIRECYSGPAQTKGIGHCKAGKQRCVDGVWGPCVGEITPKTEQCNGIDDDCDGQIDANCPIFATSAGGQYGDQGNGIALAKSGHIYITGAFYDSATFGSHTIHTQGSSDSYVAKIDPTGQFNWALSFGGTGTDVGKSIATDEKGHIYIAGHFESNVVFGAFTLSSQGGKNIYIAKMDDSGSILWATSAGGATGGIDVNSIVVDATGNTFITGSFAETAVLGATTLTSRGNSDVFVAKLDDSGKFIFATSAGGSYSDEGFDITLDASGNVYVVGYLQDIAIFGSTTISSRYYTNAFISKLSNTGQFLWTTATSKSWYAACTGVKVDKTGNVYAAGYFEEEATFGSRPVSAQAGMGLFVAQINATGQFQRLTLASGAWNTPGKGLGMDDTGNLYLTGSFSDRVAFGSHQVVAQGKLDIFVATINNTGTFAAATSIGGSESNVGNHIAVDGLGNTFIIGTFRGSITASSTKLSSRGYTDVIIAKIYNK